MVISKTPQENKKQFFCDYYYIACDISQAVSEFDYCATIYNSQAITDIMTNNCAAIYNSQAITDIMTKTVLKLELPDGCHVDTTENY